MKIFELPAEEYTIFFADLWEWISVSVYVYVCMCACVYVSVCACVCMCIWVYVYVSVCVCMCVYVWVGRYHVSNAHDSVRLRLLSDIGGVLFDLYVCMFVRL